MILLGLCLTETYLLVRNRFRWLTVLALVFIVGFWSTEALLADAQTIGRFSYPSTIYLLWRWSDVNIPPQGMILVSPQGGISDTWNRPWSGYNGTTSFQWWIADIQPQRTPDRYARDGIGYIALTNKDWAKWKDSTDFQQFTSRLFHVKTISSPAPTSEPNVDFYQVLPPQVQTNVVFGDQIALVGYDLPKQITSGAEVHLRLFWRALRHPDTNYSMFTHLYAQDPTKILAQYDGAASTLDRLTLTWDDPDEVYINDSANLKLPDNLPSGDYHLSIGLYDFINGKRLQIDQEKDAYIVLLHVSSN